MKYLSVLFSLFLFFPLSLGAQSADELLRQVSESLAKGSDDTAVSLFRQATDASADRAEVFYWTAVDKGSAVAPRLTEVLATHYSRQRDYDKACLFYREYLKHHPTDVPALTSCAEMYLLCGKEEEALALYEKALAVDVDNLQANIYLGNYYFLQAEKVRHRLDDDYKKLLSPTRMQYARYRNSLSDLLAGSYAKARDYLQRVLRRFPSTEAARTLEKIKRMEGEMR